MLKKIVLLFFMFFITFDVNATCSNEEFSILKEKAKKVEFSYDYVLEKINDYLQEDNTYAFYTITAYNLDNDLLVETKTSYGEIKSFKKNKNNTGELKRFTPGKITITIKGNTKTCDSLFRTDFMDLLYYNNLYDSDICKEYPLFKYCQNEFEKYDVLGIDFDSELEEYKEKLENEKNSENKREKTFIEEHFIAILVSSLIVVAFITIITIRIKIIVKRRSL